MKKIFSIALMIFLLSNWAGFYIYFYFRLDEIKKEIRSEMVRTSPQQFQKIVLTPDQYELFKEGDDEVEWNGFMYDIASIQFAEDRVEILALRDTIETELLSLAANIIKFSTNDSKSTPTALLQYLALNFTLPTFQEIYTNKDYSVIKYNTLYQTITSSPTLKVASPPPRG